MALSTNQVSGLASGFDWRSMIDQLIALEYRKVDLVSNRKTDYENQLSAWQDLNTKLLALNTSVQGLNRESGFDLFTSTLSSSSSTEADDLLAVTTGSSAALGTYSIEILQTARAQKLSSESFTSQTAALGTSYAGSVLINGRVVTIDATDTLTDVRDKINDLNSGTTASKITASIVSFSATDYRLTLTSQNEGADGMALQQVGSKDVLQAFGFTAAANTIKHTTSDGAKSDTFATAGTAVSSVLGLSSAPTGNATIGGEAVSIDLSKTLTQIAADIDALSGVSAQVVSSTVNDSTVYQIDISGTTSFTDDNNVLQTLGILKGTYGSVQEIHTSDTANTRTSGGSIAADTRWRQIDTGGGSNNIANSDTISITGTNHDGTAVSGTYTIADRNDRVQLLLTEIENLFGLEAGSATVTAEGKIQVTDTTPGDSALTIELTANNEGGGSLDFGTLTASQQGYSMEVQSGLDAQLKVDGNYLSRTSNTIADAIAGVGLNLKKAEVGTTVTLSVSRDLDELTQKIGDFVDKYNDVISFIAAQSAYDSENQQPGGVLFGDGTLRSVKSDLMNNIVSQVWGISSDFSILRQIGITLDNEGRLSLDDSTLKGYLQTNFEDVKNLFTASGTTTTGSLQYSTHGLNTKAGTYAVNITQAAAQGSVTGTTDLSGGLGGAETLSISVGSASAGIDLGGGMSLSEIVSTINDELDESYAEVIVGDETLYADAGMADKLSNSTVWTDVYDDTGTSAGLQDADVISFTGADRSGSTVSGSYTISDVGSDTVQGLLSAIEVAYNNTVIASINSDGNITLTDKTDGTSDISLSVSNPDGRNLQFGTIDVEPTGADGSREGRYAIQVTATASGDNKNLILTHNQHGSSAGFTVTQASDLVLGAGKDGTYTGVDVSGTINGESATGEGQRLTGDSGVANVDGLVLSYSGSSTGEVGSVSLTLGVAEALYRSLYSIADTYEGYVAFKQTSLDNSIDRLESQIEQMETRLDRKMETMINRFVAMEKAISNMQSISSWLTSQIDTLQSNWNV